jgi:hypothetical protein
MLFRFLLQRPPLYGYHRPATCAMFRVLLQRPPLYGYHRPATCGMFRVLSQRPPLYGYITGPLHVVCCFVFFHKDHRSPLNVGDRQDVGDRQGHQGPLHVGRCFVTNYRERSEPELMPVIHLCPLFSSCCCCTNTYSSPCLFACPTSERPATCGTLFRVHH